MATAVPTMDVPRVYALMYSFRQAHILYNATLLGIPDLLVNGPKHFEELARATSSHPQFLFRLLRAAAAFGLFGESPNGEFSLNATSEKLTENAPDTLKYLVLYVLCDTNQLAWGKLAEGIHVGGYPFQIAHGMPLFDYYAQNPDEQLIFNKAMAAASKMPDIQIFSEKFDFSGYRVIADIGGGHGVLMHAVLRAHPHLRGIVFDLPSAVEQGQSKLDTEFASVCDRMEFVGGDFFQSVPAADLYVMKWIIHDWNDEKSVKILANCHKSLPDNGRLVIIDRVIPPVGDTSGLEAKTLDLHMMVVCNAQERTVAEFDTLLNKAGFVLEKAELLHSLSYVVAKKK